MVPHDLDPKDAHVRPFFKGIMALLLLAMAGMLLYESIPLVMNPGAVDVVCPIAPRKLFCELGTGIVRLLPSGAQRTVLGMTGVASAVGVSWLILLSIRRKPL